MVVSCKRNQEPEPTFVRAPYRTTDRLNNKKLLLHFRPGRAAPHTTFDCIALLCVCVMCVGNWKIGERIENERRKRDCTKLKLNRNWKCFFVMMAKRVWGRERERIGNMCIHLKSVCYCRLFACIRSLNIQHIHVQCIAYWKRRQLLRTLHPAVHTEISLQFNWMHSNTSNTVQHKRWWCLTNERTNERWWWGPYDDDAVTITVIKQMKIARTAEPKVL